MNELDVLKLLAKSILETAQKNLAHERVPERQQPFKEWELRDIWADHDWLQEEAINDVVRSVLMKAAKETA